MGQLRLKPYDINRNKKTPLINGDFFLFNGDQDVYQFHKAEDGEDYFQNTVEPYNKILVKDVANHEDCM